MKRAAINSEELAFARAMSSNPSDMTPRLVYARWLEERGDPRGTSIRQHITPDDSKSESELKAVYANAYERWKEVLGMDGAAMMKNGFPCHVVYSSWQGLVRDAKYLHALPETSVVLLILRKGTNLSQAYQALTTVGRELRVVEFCLRVNVNDAPELEDLLAVKGWRPGEDFGRHINFDGKRVDFTFKGGLKALTAIGGSNGILGGEPRPARQDG